MTRPSLSFEFFPPKNIEGSFRLWNCVNVLAPLGPDFVSVTYGAGGTTRQLTHEAVNAIHKTSGLNVAAHLTCVSATRAETLAIADDYAASGVTDLVALRGDPPKGSGGFVPHPEGFASSVELIEALAGNRQVHPPRRRLSRKASRGRRHRRRHRASEAQDRRRRGRRDHPVLLPGRRLLPVPRRLRGGRHRRPDHSRHPAGGELGRLPALCRRLRHHDPAADRRRLRPRLRAGRRRPLRHRRRHPAVRQPPARAAPSTCTSTP